MLLRAGAGEALYQDYTLPRGLKSACGSDQCRGQPAYMVVFLFLSLMTDLRSSACQLSRPTSEVSSRLHVRLRSWTHVSLWTLKSSNCYTSNESYTRHPFSALSISALPSSICNTWAFDGSASTTSYWGISMTRFYCYLPMAPSLLKPALQYGMPVVAFMTSEPCSRVGGSKGG